MLILKSRRVGYFNLSFPHLFDNETSSDWFQRRRPVEMRDKGKEVQSIGGMTASNKLYVAVTV